MYDQLAVLSPVMLALTAATPIFKGRLVDTDVRWNTIATSVDDRTPAERGLLDEDPVRACVHSSNGCLFGRLLRSTSVHFGGVQSNFATAVTMSIHPRLLLQQIKWLFP